ncbi:MAG TPA: amino acid permease [Gemmatimonadales bacterium]|jgi:APA family basic amino acid/polyamine antiporter|nr:amino acid permease [Gemmatimonadales bacterium]
MTQPMADRWGDRLPRRLGFWSAAAVLVGSTIGSGIFRTPADVAKLVPDVPVFLLAWILGAVVALCGALTYAELAAAFPRTGGLYVFLREGFGPLAAFLFGWGELIIIRPGAYGAISITSAAYAIRVLGGDPSHVVMDLGQLPVLGHVAIAAEQALAASLIVLVASVNWFGIHRGAILQNLSTALKVGALVGLVAIGFVLGGGHGVPAVLSQRAPVSLSPFLVAMVAILWAYDGWADLAFVSGEVRDPQRNLPRAIIIGTAAVGVLYLGAILVYLHLIPMSQMGGAHLVAADAAQILLGPAGVVLVGAAVAVSTFGTLNGSMMTAPRIFFALAEDGLFPRAVARVDPRTGAPTGAIALAAALGALFVLVRTFKDLADQFVIGIWPFYALGVAAVFVLRRRRPELERPYRTWGYPMVPALFLLGSVFLLGNYLVSEPVKFTVDVGLIAVGIPVYLLWRRFRTAKSATKA